MVDGPSSSEAGPSTQVSNESLGVPTQPAWTSQNTASVPYYGHPHWQGQPWPLSSYQYSAAYQQQYPQPHLYQPAQFQQYHPHARVSVPPPPTRPPVPKKPIFKKRARPRTPSPSPPPKEFPRYWDAALKAFCLAVGLSQCLAGLEADILVMNPDWEKKVVPEALRELHSSISVCPTINLRVTKVR